MDPISIISTTLASITTATDIARLVINAGPSLQKAELQLKLAEMVGALADARLQMADIKQVLDEKDEVIKQLRQALELKEKLVCQDSAYWLPNGQGARGDGPFCTNCFDGFQRLSRLVAADEPNVQCPNCQVPFASKPLFDYLRPDVKERRRQIREDLQNRRPYDPTNFGR